MYMHCYLVGFHFLPYFVFVSRQSYCMFIMPPKELWVAYYSNRTVRPSVRVSVRPAFVSGPYLLYSLR